VFLEFCSHFCLVKDCISKAIIVSNNIKDDLFLLHVSSSLPGPHALLVVYVSLEL
jgi:hypothetical protein